MPEHRLERARAVNIGYVYEPPRHRWTWIEKNTEFPTTAGFFAIAVDCPRGVFAHVAYCLGTEIPYQLRNTIGFVPKPFASYHIATDWLDKNEPREALMKLKVKVEQNMPLQCFLSIDDPRWKKVGVNWKGIDWGYGDSTTDWMMLL